MTFDFERIWASKRDYRQTLAAKLIAEKLRLLDAMREVALAIRHVTPPTNIVGEQPAKYRPTKSV